MTGGVDQLARLLHAYNANPDGYIQNKNLGLFLSGVRKGQVMAKGYLLKALSMGVPDPNIGLVLDQLGNVLVIDGDLEAAEKVYRKGIDLCPHVIDYGFRLSDIVFRLGKVGYSSRCITQTIDRLQSISDRAAHPDEPRVRMLGPYSVAIKYVGELSAKFDIYLKAKALGLVGDTIDYLPAPKEMVSNQALLEYWTDFVNIVQEQSECERILKEMLPHFYYLDYFNLPEHGGMRRDLAHRVIQQMWEEQKRPPLLTLKPQHYEQGWQALERAGVPHGAWFVCLHVREAGFYDEEEKWTLNHYRNSDVETYYPAIEEIVARGGWVIRIGDNSMKPLKPMAQVIDYAHHEMKSDWMDLFVISQAKFYFGMASGPSSIPINFGVPTLGSNWYPLGHWPYCSGDMFLHKLLYSRSLERVLTIKEALTPPLFGNLEPSILEKFDLTVIDNTSEELRLAVLEMMDRLDHGYQSSPDFEVLHEKYKKCADPYGVGLLPRVAEGFLKAHPELMSAE